MLGRAAEVKNIGAAAFGGSHDSLQTIRFRKECRFDSDHPDHLLQKASAGELARIGSAILRVDRLASRPA